MIESQVTFASPLLASSPNERKSDEVSLTLKAQVRKGVELPKIRKAARDFEAVLLGQWLSAAEESLASVPGGSMERDPGDIQFRGMGVQAIAEHMAASGGVGIARMLLRGLEVPGGAPRE